MYELRQTVQTLCDVVHVGASRIVFELAVHDLVRCTFVALGLGIQLFSEHVTEHPHLRSFSSGVVSRPRPERVSHSTRDLVAYCLRL